MGEVPRPPAGLAERIKADIPKYLTAETERQRISSSVSFTMRVAASLILLFTSVFVTLHLLEPAGRSKHTSMAANSSPAVVPAVTRYAGAAKTEADTAAAPPEEEVRLEITQDVPRPASVAAPPAAPPPPPPAPRVTAPQMAFAEQANATGRPAGSRGDMEDAADARTGLASGVAGGVADGAIGEVSGGVSDGTGENSAAPAYHSVAPAPEAQPERITVTAGAPPMKEETAVRRKAAAPSQDFVARAYGDELSLQQRKSVFGISIDPGVFQNIRAELEGGDRPPADRVDIDALVNYFAGAPARPSSASRWTRPESMSLPMGRCRPPPRTSVSTSTLIPRPSRRPTGSAAAPSPVANPLCCTTSR
jgi:hypothetical protein